MQQFTRQARRPAPQIDPPVHSPYLLPSFPVHDIGHILCVEVWQQLLGDVVAGALDVDDRLHVTVHVRTLDRLRETVCALWGREGEGG